ncbi:hypothetical protein [Desulfotignum phosphitoxidans]|uniref:Uncharacterized protein n=1 Tax=Desulfotignum phosphitoxidans DSM 13687 TaxID=1286635 RepID=S0G2L7_9BACT|nr:hypothetical protein [Desulfotignum phosphitoxidans]EMS78407.1 hypothetical protein Dpo_8c00740 [Desulfotignum phosphitoxidans DSM 13687]
MKFSISTYKFLFVILLSLFALNIIGCTKKIAGIPLEDWNQLSEDEREIVLRGYNERQKIIAEERLVKAKLQAEAQADKLFVERKEAIANQKKVAHIYAGEGIYGDLLQVTVEGGQLYFYGKFKNYQPLSFRIANGESKQVSFVNQTGNGIYQEINVWMAYKDGNFIFDCGEKEWTEKYGRKFSFSLGKKRITEYQHVTLSKYSDSKAIDINISIEVIPFDKMHRIIIQKE